MEDGRWTLRSFHQISEEDRDDLVADAFWRALPKILAATTPRAFFVGVVTHAAVDRLRRRDTRRAKEDELSSLAENRQEGSDREGTLVDSIQLQRALSALGERDHDIIAAVWYGEDREEIARQHGISRAAIDQVVSRLRRRLREEP
jgi:RNA polymerase sigma factor (sigma-70 family)